MSFGSESTCFFRCCCVLFVLCCPVSPVYKFVVVLVVEYIVNRFHYPYTRHPHSGTTPLLRHAALRDSASCLRASMSCGRHLGRYFRLDGVPAGS